MPCGDGPAKHGDVVVVFFEAIGKTMMAAAIAYEVEEIRCSGVHNCLERL